MSRAAEKYIEGVLSGEILVSATTRMTFERHAKDLRNAPEQGWYFDKKAADKVLAFGKLLRHSPDKRSWVPFQPEPWQEAVMYIVFGWHKKDGTRRFTYAYIEIPKKNGKTTWSAVIANYLLWFDGENEAEVYMAATVEKQARLCFDKAKQMIDKSPPLAKRARMLTKNVSVMETASKMEPLGRDSESMEGINPSGAILDELHVWPNFEVFENLQSASVNRKQPLFWIITTAGRDKNLPCFTYRNLVIDILKGVKWQPDTFGVIYTIDEKDDWKDPRVWMKANPNWNISVIPERFESEFQGAMNDPTKEVSFKTKNLNIWVDAPEVWIPDEKWMACQHKTTDDDLRRKECWAGIDLASHVDLTALVLFFPEVKGHPVIKAFFWIPEDKIKEKEDRVDYRDWVSRKLITVTEGGIIDVDQMSDDVMKILKEYNVKLLSYDPYMMHHGVIQNIQKLGFPASKMNQYAQSLKNMSPPTKEFQRMVISGELDHMGNPVLRWNMRNVVILQDTNENIRPDKKRSAEKIDGIVAAITAIGGWMAVTGDQTGIIYKDHELRSVKMW